MASINMTNNGASTPFAHAGGDLYVSWTGQLGGGEFSVEFDPGSGYRTQHSTSALSQKNLKIPAGNVRFRIAKANNPNVHVDYL